MPEQHIGLQNFTGGEVSEKLYGRFDLSIYPNALKKAENIYLETQGGFSYRPGTIHVNRTAGDKVARLAPFQFNDEQAYVLEFTDQKLRFFRNEGAILESSVAVTGLTAADPGVVTATAHGYSNGDTVFVAGVGGMFEVNDRFYLVANKTNNTFELTDLDGNDVDTSGFTAYTSGGTVARVYEITTPYTEANDLFKLKMTQNADTIYIVHPFYEPRKLTRTGHTAWTLSRFTRTNDPFLDEKAITGITQANPGVVTATAHGYSNGDVVIIEEVDGMTEVNGQPYIVANKTSNTFELTDLDGNNVDTSAFTAYSANGIASNQNLLPFAVAFYESRLFYGGWELLPDGLIGSRSPDSNGSPRYDDFTSGTDADHAVEFSINNAEVNRILWLTGTSRLLLAGTFGTVVKITGTDDEQAITPTSVKARALDRIGVADVSPVNKQTAIFYAERSGLTINGLEFDALQDDFTPRDQNLLADHVLGTGVKQMAWENGRPSQLWVVRKDGQIATMTFNRGEQINGWARQRTGGTNDDLFLSLAPMGRPSSFEQIWVVVERVVNGVTTRAVEFFSDFATIPERLDFFTEEDSEADDDEVYAIAMEEAQKSYIHLDAALTYDGTARGSNASSTVTPGAKTGDGVTFTSDVNVFRASDVGQEIRKKSVDGVGTGRATIVTFTDAQNVDCDIIQDFDSTGAMAPGDWYITTEKIYNAGHLEGRSIGVVADGMVHPDETVATAQVSFDFPVAKAHIGLKYEGLAIPLNPEFGGARGPANTKDRHIRQVDIRFLKSGGAVVGTDLYQSELVRFTEMPLQLGRPQRLFTGTKAVPFADVYDRDKTFFIKQKQPLPMSVQALILYGEADDG